MSTALKPNTSGDTAPGPIPSLVPIALQRGARPTTAPDALEVVVEPGTVVDEVEVENISVHVTSGLEVARPALQTSFMVLVLLTVPFMAYVLVSKAGFSLTDISYPVLALTMIAVTVASRMSSSEAAWSDRITKPFEKRQLVYAVALQVIPIAGFDLWRHGGRIGSLYSVIPLVALCWVFMWVTGTLAPEPSSD